MRRDGVPMTFVPRHWGDISNFYSFSLNPAKSLSGLVLGPFMTGSAHNFQSYVP
jgi:hypothetical protein